MRNFYHEIEVRFEKMSELSTRILGNSILFIAVLGIVVAWTILVMSGQENIIDKIRDCFIAVSFLSFFLVQRALNKYNRAINVKLSELVRADDKADNGLINVEEKSHREIDALANELHAAAGGTKNNA